MSVRTNRWWLVSALAVGALTAQGCDDEEKKPDVDAGVDAGGPGDGQDGDGDMDAGPDGGGGGDGEMCLGEPCEDTMALLKLPACCDEEAGGACGANLAPINEFAMGQSPLGDKCFAKNQPGDESAHCSDFFDFIDGMKNGQFDLNAGGIVLSFPGCCADSGECGVALNEFTFNDSKANLGLGCVPFSRFTPPSAGDAGMPDAGAPAGDAGAAPAPTLADVTPYCVPGKKKNDAACPPVLLPQICEGLAAAGLGCTAGEPTPDWICAQAGLPEVSTGDVPVVDTGCMEGVPEVVAGCGLNVQYTGTGTFCVSNVDTDVYGCEEVTTDIAGVPSFACGCGDEVTPGAVPCIANVPVTVCGADAFTPVPKTAEDGTTVVAGATCVPNFPEIMSGCGATEPANGYPTTCIPHQPATVIGCVNVTDANKAIYMANVPNIACGCGDTTVNTVGPTDPAFCLTAIPTDICGAVPACTEGQACTPAGGAADSGTCLDLKGTGGTNNGGDDIGDFCQPPT